MRSPILLNRLYRNPSFLKEWEMSFFVLVIACIREQKNTSISEMLDAAILIALALFLNTKVNTRLNTKVMIIIELHLYLIFYKR